MHADAVNTADDSAPRNWLGRNGWRLGLVLAALAGGYWWRRSIHSRRINVGPVSERWLAEQEFTAGQQSSE